MAVGPTSNGNLYALSQGQQATPLESETASKELARHHGSIRHLLRALGPGLVAGASDDDPSSIGTYAMAGAALGYGGLWIAWLTYPLMTAVQFLCAKVGLVSGSGLAGVLREYYPRKLLYLVVTGLMIANTINAGADILGIAAGINLLVPLPLAVIIGPVGLAILALQIWGSYRFIATTFKWLTLSLFGYIAASFLARPDWGQVLRGTFVPQLEFNHQWLAMIVALLGTTISPYLFFWQASQEVEERTARGRRRLWQLIGTTDRELKYAAWDVNIGMFFSNVVMFFVILASAATLHASGKTEVNSAAEAAEALRPLAGNLATALMALGFIGTGVLTVPILTTSASYAVCEAVGWNCSLDAKPSRAKGFYLVIAGSTLAALAIDYVGVNPMAALFWTSVINGLLAPPMLVVIMLVTNNRQVMGRRVNGWGINTLGWATTALMFAAAIGLIVTWGQS
jgi:NRAMP (natural resistance-associated macrophage protein)-like metal ion transporter